MRRGMVLATLLMLWPVAVRAQTAEALLPSKSQIYFRWDGLAAHRGDFDKTAIGKTLKGDTGKFFDELLKFAGEHIENGLNQADPNAVGIYKDITRIMRGLIQDGVVVGIEAEKVNPPKVQGVIVFPKAADETGTLLPLIQKAADAGRAEVKDTKVGRRFLHRLEVDNVPGLHVAWWKEGEDAVVTIGTIDPVDYVKAVDAKTTGIAKHPLYKQLQSFKEFKTSSRGFIDVKGISGTVSNISPEVAKLVDELGVKGVKSVVFVGGYDGPAQRAVVEVDIPGPRNGLLSIISSKKFGLKDLPPMPNDITGFSAGSIEFGKAYDSITQVATGAIKIFAPDQADNITGTVKAFEAVLGIKFGEDIFANFGDMVVNYSSPSESIFGFGGTTLVKVKDGKKLMAGIDTLVKNIPQQPGFEVVMKKKKYKDGEMAEVYLKTDAITNLIGCIGLHKDWFIYSQYPQGIKGYILRANGELPTWKANEELTKILAEFPKEFTGITVSDPRPTVEFLLAAAPFAVNLANTLTSQFLPGSRQFDLDLIPHAQDATRHLFPNVTISTDDGKKLRSVTRNSFP